MIICRGGYNKQTTNKHVVTVSLTSFLSDWQSIQNGNVPLNVKQIHNTTSEAI